MAGALAVTVFWLLPGFDCNFSCAHGANRIAAFSRVVARHAGVAVSLISMPLRDAGVTEEAVFCRKGSGQKKEKAVNPWPMSGKVDDPAAELFMLCIGLVLVLFLAIYAHNKGL